MPSPCRLTPVALQNLAIGAGAVGSLQLTYISKVMSLLALYPCGFPRGGCGSSCSCDGSLSAKGQHPEG